MRYAIILTSMLLGAALPANAEVSIAIAVPGLSIGINMPVYPQFQRVPNYPVYYAPQSGFNLFFYDGMYWAFQNDNWYASTWYNGPWGMVAPMYVPVYMLRVPVRYYQRPPPYFRGWSHNEPPRWGQHYGKHWEQERHGWDNWNRNSAPPPAPLPLYQRQYTGDRYPRYEQQPVIRSQNYRYQPSDPVVRQTYQHEEVEAKRHSQPQQQQRSEPKQQPQQRYSEPQQQQHNQQQREQQQQQSQQQHSQQQQQQSSQQPQQREQQQQQSKQQHSQQQQSQPQQQQSKQPHGTPAGQAQAPASDQQNAPQGKGSAKKDSKSGQPQDDGTDQGQGNGQGNGQDKGQGHTG
jgi:hypothetical protein